MACKYFDTIKKKHYIYDRVDGSFSGQIADMEYYVCKGTNDRAICTCGGCIDKCDYYKPEAIQRLVALGACRKLIDELDWNTCTTEEETEILNTIWRIAEKTIRSEAECLE